MMVPEATYRRWFASSGAGSRLNLADVRFVGGGITGKGVFQYLSERDDFDGLLVGTPPSVQLHLDFWNMLWSAMQRGLLETIELIHIPRGLALRMYVEDIPKAGTANATHVVVPLTEWSVYGPGNALLQPGFLAREIPVPTQVEVVQEREVEGPPIDAAPGAAPGAIAATLAAGHKIIVLHPKAWTDQYLAVVEAKLGFPGKLVLAREAWTTFTATRKSGEWAQWPGYVTREFDGHILPIAVPSESRIGVATAQILQELRDHRKPVVVWIEREGTFHPLLSWRRVSKDMAAGWEVTW